jgi:hypothetical protein
MSAIARKETEYDARYGITSQHWGDIRYVATRMNRIIMIRGGKKSAIQWIERNFPGKPMALGFLKVDREKGLLLARTEQENQRVFAAGYYVLEYPQGPGGRFNPVIRQFVAARRRGRSVEKLPRQYQQVGDPWAELDVVIDSSGKPFTSDYDVAAIIDPGDHRWGKTFLWSVPEGAGKKPDKTSIFTGPVIEALNQRMRLHPSNDDGDPVENRFLHGTNAQHSGSPAQGDESILVFYPGGPVEVFHTPNVQHAREALLEVLAEHTPAGAGNA